MLFILLDLFQGFIEIINYLAKAAIGEKNLEQFEHYFLQGIHGAKALKSEKRRQEAVANWKTARVQWPHEKKLLALAEALF